MPAIGIRGSTSVAPMRGCAPLWRRMSIVSAARFTPRKAASTTSSGDPTNVTTVRLVASPGSTSSSRIPSTDPMASVICRITAASRPSLKLGTHSTILFIITNFSKRKFPHPQPPALLRDGPVSYKYKDFSRRYNRFEPKIRFSRGRSVTAIRAAGTFAPPGRNTPAARVRGIKPNV